MKQMPFILLLVGGFAIYGLNSEYQSIKARLATTQAKIDNLTDETNATVEILGAAIQDLRDVFAKLSSEAKPSLPSYKPTLEIKPTIIMHSGASCGPCNDWKAKQMPVWTEAGWEVQVIKEVESSRIWPWFEVRDSDGTTFEVDGALNKDSFLKGKASVK